MENENIVERITRLETKEEQHDKDIIELKDTQKMMYEMNSNIKSIVDKIGNTNEEICEFKADVKKDIGDLRKDMNDVKNKDDKKDAKKWNSSMKTIGTVILSAIIGIVLAKIGLI